MTDITSKPQNKTKEFLTSLLISFAFLFNSICLLVNILIPSVENFGEIFVVAILLLGIGACAISSIKINYSLLRINVILLLAMLGSFLYYENDDAIKTLLTNFIVWGIGITILMMQEYSMEKVLSISFKVSIIVMIFDIITNADENYDSMVWAYAVLPCIAVTIVHFVYIRFTGLLSKIAYIPGFLMLIKFVLNANRGGLISLAVLVILLNFKAKDKSNNKLKNKYLLGTLLIILFVILIVFIEQITLYLYDTLASYGVEVSAIKKMYRLIEADNVSNNREELYNFAWNGFLSSPVFGNGIGGFSVNHGGWAHNLILQLLYEGGVILTALILVPLIKSSVFILKSTIVTVEEYSMYIVLFSTSIPRLLFSTELWNTQAFWMLFALCILIGTKYKNKKRGRTL